MSNGTQPNSDMSCLAEFVLILALSILALLVGVAWVVAEVNGSPVR